MADDFGLKIGLEGEKEFKKALSEINQSFKVLGSEMKVVQSQFDKNDSSVEALTARNQVLNKEIEAQKQKIETLRSALANASESFGENDRRTQQWQIQLNNATAALNDMERELDRNNTALDEVLFVSLSEPKSLLFLQIK
jgi:phage-related minor tail protein